MATKKRVYVVAMSYTISGYEGPCVELNPFPDETLVF